MDKQGENFPPQTSFWDPTGTVLLTSVSDIYYEGAPTLPEQKLPEPFFERKEISPEDRGKFLFWKRNLSMYDWSIWQIDQEKRPKGSDLEEKFSDWMKNIQADISDEKPKRLAQTVCTLWGGKNNKIEIFYCRLGTTYKFRIFVIKNN